MPSFEEFEPPFGRSEAVIRAEMEAAANAGLTVDDPEWVDVAHAGAFLAMAIRLATPALARAHDRMNEIAAASTVATAWDTHLDRHAESLARFRLPASQATGTLVFTGTNGTLVGTNVRAGPLQTDPEIDPPIFETTSSGTVAGGTLTLPIRAVNPGTSGNLDANSITQLITGVPGITSVNNTVATGGGEEMEDDEHLRDRLISVHRGTIWGTKGWYENVALEYPGVGRVSVIPHRDGAGTVAVIILDNAGHAVAAPTVSGLQAALDPSPGMGEGLAPVEHYVTVGTAVNVPIHVTATVALEPGYSLDSTSGGVALRTRITNAIRAYLDQLQAGEDVVYNHVEAQFFKIEGVFDVSLVKIGTAPSPSGTTNIVITDAPAQVAVFGSVVLS